MPSLKSHLVAFVLRRTRKKSFASVEGMHRRLRAARKSEHHAPPPGLSARLDIAEHEFRDHPVYEVDPKGRTGSRHIVYLHGGAYLFEITPHHWKLIAEMAERLDAHVTVPIYPLAPEAKHPEIIGWAMALHREMLTADLGRDLVFMGDSAGANMALVLSMLAAEEGLPQPTAMVLISPAVDMSMVNPEIARSERHDPWLGQAGAREATRLYAGDVDLTDWRISPLYGDLSVLPRTLMLGGTRDIVTHDARLLAERAREAGADVTFEEEEGMFHVWPLIDMPEGRAARDGMVAFLRER